MGTGYNKSIFSKGTATYSDIDISFKANPFTGDIRTKENADSIKQSLTNLIYTNFGERPFRPNLGAGINNILFQPLDPITANELKDLIKDVVYNWEPRIQIVTLSINQDTTDDNTVNIILEFNMVNIQATQQISIILERTR